MKQIAIAARVDRAKNLSRKLQESKPKNAKARELETSKRGGPVVRTSRGDGHLESEWENECEPGVETLSVVR